MLNGTSQIAVTFSSALPSANYSVSVVVTSGNGYNTSSSCRYWNVTAKTTTGFTIEDRLCSSGNLSNVDANAILDWIAIERK
jgi:hypothetical protein